MLKAIALFQYYNGYYKVCGYSFYCFLRDEDCQRMNVNCYHSEERLETHRNSWMCSAHSVSRKKSDDKLSPDYVPTIFDHIVSPLKRKAKLNSVIGFLAKNILC